MGLKQTLLQDQKNCFWNQLEFHNVEFYFQFQNFEHNVRIIILILVMWKMQNIYGPTFYSRLDTTDPFKR